eukprot:4984501-Amphidinium_carterae.1
MHSHLKLLKCKNQWENGSLFPGSTGQMPEAVVGSTRTTAVHWPHAGSHGGSTLGGGRVSNTGSREIQLQARWA